MKRAFTLTLLWLALAFADGPNASAATTADADGFRRGNALYAAGDFAGAAAAYEGQVRRGEFAANLFSNLADAYYRLGDRGRAVLNYQRALLLERANAEAAANLAFVRGQKPGETARSFSEVDALAWAAAAAGWAAVAGLLAWTWRGRWRAVGAALFFAGLAVCAAALCTLRAWDDHARDAARAIVVAAHAPALYAPADNSKVFATLTAGAELRVLSDQGAWVYALLGDGTRAWVASKAIERVVPR